MYESLPCFTVHDRLIDQELYLPLSSQENEEQGKAELLQHDRYSSGVNGFPETFPRTAGLLVKSLLFLQLIIH